MKKVSRHIAAIARKPSTTMTAIAQRGKEESDIARWTCPSAVDVCEAKDWDLKDREADKELEDAAASDEDEETESRTVV